ncbi:MAG: DUF1116 domain-containing protein [Actinomycetota bacterium]|nr:DUF1116 domain-containing protein [Actinomycetota bacterium]
MSEASDANRTAIERVLASEPWLVGVRPAGEVVPRFEQNLILHAAPAAPWNELSPLLRGGLIGAARFEELAESSEEAEAKLHAGEIVLGAAQDHSAMAGGVGSISASLPVLVLEDRSNGNRAFHFLMEGFGKTLILGMYDSEVRERLVWIRDELAPALDVALEALGGIDARALMVEALRRGDELHNRNAAATSMLAELLAPALAAEPPAVRQRIFDFLRGNPQFFVGVSLAASRLALDAGHGIAGSSLVTAVGANGNECGIKISGLGEQWFRAPAEVPVGVFLDGFGSADAGPSCGDSLSVECAGLGATVLAAAPALWPLVDADESRARRIFEETARISLGEHPHYRVPLFGNVGAPTGIDLLRVVETGIRPVIDIVMVHRQPGLGLIGFGLTSPPAGCFEQAAEAFHLRYDQAN